ncbi:MAG: hypothetical protein IPK16_00440 [Anaerolineales bacterium]|nr:hypothetical protein [Anaerolineales bacterium]
MHWLTDPVEAAPLAFLNLYLANLEVRLFEGAQWQQLAQVELTRLSRAAPWRQARSVSRTLLLSFWLAQDGAGLAAWLAEDTAAPDVWPMALGLQALLQTPLSADQIIPLLRVWRIPGALPAPNTIAQRITTLATVLEAEPLQYALAYLDEPARAAKAWRTQHRDLKLELPQPDLRAALEPVLRELIAAVAPVPLAVATGEPATQAEPAGGDLAKAHMIVEFGHSRSDIFEYALRQAKKQPGFQQLMDENLHVIYRVPFRRNEMRRFWGLWDCVQTWTSTRVYCQGQELQKWQVYPYSQFIS